MKITSVSSPNAVQSAGSDWESNAAAAKARALAAFKSPAAPAAQAEQLPVPNANAVAPEDMSAIRPASQVNQVNAETISPAELSDTNATTSEEATPTTQEIRQQAQRDPEEQRRFEQLARQEKAFRAKVQQAQTKLNQREADLRAKEDALKQRETSSQVDLSKYISIDQVKDDALSVLDAAGVDWDSLTRQAVERQPTDPRVLRTMKMMEEKISKLEGELENSKQTQTKAQQDAYQSAVKQLRVDASKLITSDPEFEITKSYGKQGVNEVVSLIEKIYAKDGVVISVEEAAKLVEEDYAEEVDRLNKLGKVQKRLGSMTTASQKPADAKTPSNQQQQTRTLTNAVSTQRPLTAKERAVAAFEGKTK